MKAIFLWRGRLAHAFFEKCVGEAPTPHFYVLTFLLLLSGCSIQRPSDPAVHRGVKFLEQSQQPDGFWGTGTETHGFEVYSMVPGSHDAYRVGTTALCI